MKGFRTYLVAIAVMVEPLLEAALASANVDFQLLLRQVVIGAAIVTLRTVTTTPPGKGE